MLLHYKRASNSAIGVAIHWQPQLLLHLAHRVTGFFANNAVNLGNGETLCL